MILKSRKVLVFLITVTLMTTAWFALRPNPQDPKLHGVLVFHRYSDYSAWNSQMYLINLESRQIVQMSRQWKNVISPINGHFSKDGLSLTFMASQAGLVENEWDVFVSHWNGTRWAEPINITGPNGKRDEDPKFSPVDDTIVYKQDGVLATRNSDGSDFKLLTSDEPESSMPYFLPNGTDILFERGGKIILRRANGENEMRTLDNLSTYYPIGVDTDRFLYTQIQSTRHDSIYFGFYDGHAPQRLFFDSEDYESSDSYPYEDANQFVFYVSTNPISLKGGYNLFFADIKNQIIFDMDSYAPGANTDLLELGPAWSANAPFGA